jgi:hypothetical protein
MIRFGMFGWLVLNQTLSAMEVMPGVAATEVKLGAAASGMPGTPGSTEWQPAQDWRA